MPLKNLESFSIILATRSPRRHTLLAGLDLPFQVVLKDELEERFPEGLDPEQIALYLADLKARPYATEIDTPGVIVITADTIVCHDGKVLGKPLDSDHAVTMLKNLAGQKHLVVTGVSIQSLHRKVRFAETTSVWFRELSDQEIAYYVETYKPFDKAGAYGAQEWIGYMAIERIEGSYFNVMGLPVHRLYEELKQF